MQTKSILRPQYTLDTINSQIKRLRQSMDTIRQIQFESSVSSVYDEFNHSDHTDSSTPKKTTTMTTINDDNHIENSLNNLGTEINEQFDEDDTILADSSTPSNQSLASFCSAYSTTENNTFTSPEKSVSN